MTSAACLLILEGGVRLDDRRRSQLPKAAPQALSLMEENPAGTGSYRLKPNLDVETRVGSTSVRIKTNSHGMHWRETSLSGTPGRPRVAFLGDSFTFGSWASDSAHSFVGMFESSLPGGSVEALNFGVGGYGLIDEELLLKEKAILFGPQYVVVVSYMGNDFRDTFLGLNRDKIIDGGAQVDPEVVKNRVPAEFLKSDDRLPSPCPKPLWRRAAERSAAFRRMEPLLDLEDLCVVFRPNQGFFQPAFWSRTPPPDIVLKARDAVWESLSRMSAYATERGIQLAVVALPTSPQVYALEPVKPHYDTALPQSYLQTFCKEHGIPYLDLLPLLRRQAEASNRRLYLKGDTHLNDFGHAKVGELIARWFESSVRKPSAR